MSLLVDTHTHLFHSKLAPQLAAVMARAQQVCSHVLLPNLDSNSLPAMKSLADAYPGFALPMMGLHPTSVKAESLGAELDLVQAELSRGDYIAVGETGIDLYWDSSTLALQQQALREQLLLAKQLQLPIVLHSRNAFTECIELVEEAQDGNLTGVFHCFTGSLVEAQRAIKAGFYLGVGGTLTYKGNEALRQVIQWVGIKHLVLETDSPYLTPEPHRGKPNESYYLSYVAQQLASLYQLPITEVAERTTANAFQLFKLN